MKLSEIGGDAGSAPAAEPPKPLKLSDVTAPSFTEGVGTGLKDKLYGATQLGAHLTVPEDPMVGAAPLSREAIDKTVRSREQQLETEGYNKGWGRTVGNLLGDMAVTAPLAVIPGAPAVTTLGRIWQGVRAGAAGGAVTGIVEPVAHGDYGTEKAKQIGVSTGTGAAVGGVLGKIGDALAKDTPESINRFVLDKFSQVVKPSRAGQTGAPALERYDEQTLGAIKSIAENRANLRLTDEVGNEVVGQLPKSLKQFSESIEQSKERIFQQYDALAQEAGGAGARVDLSSAARALREEATKPEVIDLHPNVAAQANALADRLEERGFYSASEAQGVIQNLNKTLEGFYRNPTDETVALSGLHATLANTLRGDLDAAIEGVVGPGYQALRNQYGSLKAIEKHVAHAVRREANKIPGGIGGIFANLGAGEEAIRGVLTLNPKALLTAAGIKASQAYFKYLNAPNRAISRLFEMTAQPAATSPGMAAQSAMGAAPMLGGAMGDSASSAFGLQSP